MGKAKAPTPPDPNKVAGAQTATNIGTAIAQTGMNNVNQVTPDGNLIYEVTGNQSWTDPNTGKVHQIPRYTATQTLSATGQATKAQDDRASLGMSTLAADQTARLGSILSAPVNLSNEATEGRLMELGRKRLDPALRQRTEDLRTSLSNQGIKMGSSAYDRAMETDTQGANDAYNSLLLSGRGQSVQEELTARNQPINEISALRSASQVSQPNYAGTNVAQMPTTDIAGLTMNSYQQRLAAWQQKQSGIQSTLGGLMGLGAAAITAGGSAAAGRAISDRRLKADVRRVGKRGGLNLYEYRYIWDKPGTVHRGFMAQEVARVKPDAVRTVGPWMALDYNQLPEVA